MYEVCTVTGKQLKLFCDDLTNLDLNCNDFSHWMVVRITIPF